MGKVPLFRLAFCIDQVAHGAALHKNDGLMAIWANRCGRQAIDIPGLYFPQNFFKGESGHMVAFITQDHPIFRYERFYILFLTLKKGLHDGNIDDPASRIFPCADLADSFDSFLPAAPLGRLR